MKKIFTLFIVAVLGLTVMSCNSKAKEEAAAAEKEAFILDSIAKVEAQQLVEDSIANVTAILQAEVDSLEAVAKAAEEEASKAKSSAKKKVDPIKKKIESGENVVGKRGRKS